MNDTGFNREELPALSASPVGIQPLLGARLILERSAPEHTKFLQSCYRDSAFMDLYRLTQSRKESEEQISARLERECAFLPQQRRFIEWVIFRRLPDGDKRPIGLGSLADYLQVHKRAEFLIGLLDKAEHRTGAALEATLLILDFAFNQVGLNKVMSLVYGFNPDSQANTLQLGFVQEGFLREHICPPNMGPVDLYQNGMLMSDFRANQRLARLSKRILRRDITQPPLPPDVLSKDQLSNIQNDFMAQLLKPVSERSR